MRAALRARQAEIILHRGARIGVVPARQVHDRHIGIAVVEPLGIDAGLLPVIVENAVRPLLEQIVLVFGRGADRRIPLAPRHAREPGSDVLRLQRRLDCRVAGIGERVAVGPGRLLQVERAAVADAAAIGVGEAAAIEELRRQTRRVEAAERRLRVRGIGQAERPDAAVAPGLAHQPGERVVAVLGLAEIFREAARPSDSGRGNPDRRRHSRARRNRRRPRRASAASGRGGALGSARRRFVVGRAFEQDRERPGAIRAVDVGRQHDAVARRHHQVALYDHPARARHLAASMKVAAEIDDDRLAGHRFGAAHRDHHIRAVVLVGGFLQKRG